MCKHTIIFTPKYKRKSVYSQLSEHIQKRIRDLCKYKLYKEIGFCGCSGRDIAKNERIMVYGIKVQ